MTEPPGMRLDTSRPIVSVDRLPTEPATAPPHRDTDNVLVPRDLLAAVRIEIRALTGHWAVGLAPVAHIVKHDRVMPDGSCCTCALLAELDHYGAIGAGEL